MMMLQEADVAPASQEVAAVEAERKKFATVMGQWNTIKTGDVPKLNAQLEAAGIEQIRLH